MINLEFSSDALPVDTFQILEFTGEEKISQLFRFELRLVSRDPDIDFKTILESSASLAITTQDKTRYVHGMLSEFKQSGAWHSGLYEYNAVLVPRLWMMTQSMQNQIYQDQTVPEIIESELGNLGGKGDHPLVKVGLGVADYELFTQSPYEQREYVVQYKETDFNFISRLMEHEGIYYYFENDEEVEKLVISDDVAQQQSSDLTPVMFQAEAAVTSYTYNAVSRFSRTQKQIPGSVLVKDFNYRSPSLPMQATGDVTAGGIGFITEFGAHFKSPEEGEKLANIRAEEHRCQQNIYDGESNVSDFSCGQLYSLMNHFRDDYNQDYLITRVRHHASQAIQSWGNIGDTSYHNEFSCIPSDLPYRPQRLTPKPKLFGIMNGVIDSEQDMNRADIDELGRYKVMMPFDISGSAPGKASRRIRMAQPYGGGGAGMSFPLVKGTEVIWTCIDGDIDRPIITGAVPNPLNPSVTTTDNNTSNVIKTTGGILMSFNDGSGNTANKQSSSDESLAAQQQNQQTENVNISSPVSSDRTTQELSLQQQETLTLRDGWKVGEDVQEDDTNYQILVPHGTKKAYLRMGGNCGDETITNSDDSSVGVPTDSGWVDYTDGDRLSVTQGEKIENINGGNYSLNISNGALMESNASQMWHDSFTDVGGGVWRRFTVDYTCSSNITFGDSEEIFGGAKFEGFVGLATGVTLGGSLSASIGAAVEYKAGVDFSFGATVSNDSQDNRLEVSTASHQMTAGTRMRININPARSAKSVASNKASIAAVAAVGVAATSAVAAVPIILGGASDSGSIGKTAANSAALGVGYGLATALQTALVAKGFEEVGSSQADGGEVAELDIKAVPPGVRLGMGAETGPSVPCLTGPGIDITPDKITIGFGPLNQIVISTDGIKLITPKLNSNTVGLTTISSGGPLSLKTETNTSSLVLTTSGSALLKGTTDCTIQGATSKLF